MRHVSVLSTIIPCLMIAFLTGCAENPADNTEPAKTEEAFETSSTPVEGTTYTLVADTAVGFVGSKVTGSHAGGFKEVSGSIVVPEGNLEKAQINVTIDMKTLWSDSDKLTGHLKSADFFEVEAHPESTFTSTTITKSDAGYTVNGNLTLHGVTKGITFPATISIVKDTLAASAEFSILRTDFGIVYKGKADDLIRPEVVLSFDLNAKK